MVSISVIIPCFNEANYLEKIIQKVVNSGVDIKEIIIVDDCSTDNSKNIIKNILKNNKNIIAFFHDKNSGKGAALKTGFKNATGEIILIQDADLEYDPKDYKKLNPKNLVPTMIDNGKVIPDSIEIMKHINSTYTQGTDLFPLNINNDKFKNLLDFVKLDEKKELGETLGTTAGGISATVLVRLLCKRSLLNVIWDYLTKHSIKKRVPIFILLRILGKPPESLCKKMAIAISKHLFYIENLLKHKFLTISKQLY